ncbi:N-glycosylase [Euryarchaeota archaeon SM23-78]|nr:MAG: N-glycosylase [Euryarchaeota archaeon SM23-78]
MRKLTESVKKLKKSKVKILIDKKLKEFEAFKNKNNKDWFCELCFCILTANSKAKTAINIQKEVRANGFCTWCLNDIKGAIKKYKHRFHNNKAKFIVEARKHLNIKDKIKKVVKQKGQQDGQSGAREWLVKNIKGLGYKEASHFLRNVGYFDVAILDRHVLNLMYEDGVIKEIPKTLSKKKYLEIENKFLQLASKLGMSPAELDLYLWSMKTGVVLK